MKVAESRHFIDGRNGEFTFDIYADTHFGSMSVAEDRLKEDIQDTLDNDRHWIFLGDGIDGITPNDSHRFESKNLTDWAWIAYRNHRLIGAEYDYWAELFKPIASKCIAYVKGDGKHSKHENVEDCRMRMLTELGIPGAYQLLYHTFKLQRTNTSVASIPIAFHHGYFAGRTSGSKVNNLVKSLAMFPEAWGFFCGHGHTKVQTNPIVGLVERAGQVKETVRRAAMTGSYIKTYAEDTVGYGEVKMYNPVTLGKITVTLRPYHKRPEKRIEITNT